MTMILDLILGIVTGIGGFAEIGSISTAAQAGSEFGFQLLWAIAIATLLLAMLLEMSGRLAVVSRQSVASAVRERFGIHFHSVPLIAELIIDVLLLTAEIGGVAIAIKLLTGAGIPIVALPIGLAVWLVFWKAGCSVIEYGIGLLGLVTLCFVAAAWRLHPDPAEVARSLIPTTPRHDIVRYTFLAVSIAGATVSPYLLNFYSSGCIEQKLKVKDLWAGKLTAYIGTIFGGVVSMGVLITSAIVLGPLGVRVDTYEQAATMLTPVFHQWATVLFAASLGIGCFGAALELTINAGYVAAQVGGWSWGMDKPRRDAARFSIAGTVILSLAVVIAAIGMDPLQLTMVSAAMTVMLMPLVVLPFLVLMNDARFVTTHTNGRMLNAVLAIATISGALMAIVIVPLEILGG